MYFLKKVFPVSNHNDKLLGADGLQFHALGFGRSGQALGFGRSGQALLGSSAPLLF